jgi:hypothetical protein
MRKILEMLLLKGEAGDLERLTAELEEPSTNPRELHGCPGCKEGQVPGLKLIWIFFYVGVSLVNVVPPISPHVGDSCWLTSDGAPGARTVSLLLMNETRGNLLLKKEQIILF